MSDPRIPGHTIYQWAHDVLVAMGIDDPPQASVQAMVDWANHESGGYHPGVPGGLNNPLNTTENHFGSSGSGGSQGNIRDFGTYDQGIQNQAWNLTQTQGAGYEPIVAALRAGDQKAIYSAVNSSHFGTHNLGAGGAAATGSVAQTTKGGLAHASTADTVSATQKFKIPPGGTLYAVDGTYVVVYKVGNDSVYYDFSEPGINAKTDIGAVHFGGTMTHQQFYATPGLVHAGVASELSGSDLQSAANYQSWLGDKLMMLTGGNKAMMNDPGVVSVILQGAAHNWSIDEITAKLKTTNYWKTHDDQQRNWQTLSPAEQQSQVNAARADLQNAWFAATGQQINPADKDLNAWATKIASGGGNITEATWQWIRPEASENPQSPWSRQLEQEKEAQRQQGVDVSNMGGHVQDLFNQYGMKPSAQSQQQWATDIVTKKKSEQDLTKTLQAQATVLYPWAKDQLATGMTIKDVSQPWVDTYNRVMEQRTDLFNPQVQSALTQGQPIYDFEKKLKSTDAWLGTANARDTLTTAASTIGQKMGFLK